ncbi:MAG: hypothetical protein HON90_01630, partial [Halobacteriovoraceae bacterium]|nr:hypothetical protein [Halobacteriovoraceae bacterium]
MFNHAWDSYLAHSVMTFFRKILLSGNYNLLIEYPFFKEIYPDDIKTVTKMFYDLGLDASKIPKKFLQNNILALHLLKNHPSADFVKENITTILNESQLSGKNLNPEQELIMYDLILKFKLSNRNINKFLLSNIRRVNHSILDNEFLKNIPFNKDEINEVKKYVIKTIREENTRYAVWLYAYLGSKLNKNEFKNLLPDDSRLDHYSKKKSLDNYTTNKFLHVTEQVQNSRGSITLFNLDIFKMLFSKYLEIDAHNKDPKIEKKVFEAIKILSQTHLPQYEEILFSILEERRTSTTFKVFALKEIMNSQAKPNNSFQPYLTENLRHILYVNGKNYNYVDELLKHIPQEFRREQGYIKLLKRLKEGKKDEYKVAKREYIEYAKSGIKSEALQRRSSLNNNDHFDIMKNVLLDATTFNNTNFYQEFYNLAKLSDVNFSEKEIREFSKSLNLSRLGNNMDIQFIDFFNAMSHKNELTDKSGVTSESPSDIYLNKLILVQKKINSKSVLLEHLSSSFKISPEAKEHLIKLMKNSDLSTKLKIITFLDAKFPNDKKIKKLINKLNRSKATRIAIKGYAARFRLPLSKKMENQFIEEAFNHPLIEDAAKSYIKSRSETSSPTFNAFFTYTGPPTDLIKKLNLQGPSVDSFIARNIANDLFAIEAQYSSLQNNWSGSPKAVKLLLSVLEDPKKSQGWYNNMTDEGGKKNIQRGTEQIRNAIEYLLLTEKSNPQFHTTLINYASHYPKSPNIQNYLSELKNLSKENRTRINGLKKLNSNVILNEEANSIMSDYHHLETTLKSLMLGNKLEQKIAKELIEITKANPDLTESINKQLGIVTNKLKNMNHKTSKDYRTLQRIKKEYPKPAAAVYSFTKSYKNFLASKILADMVKANFLDDKHSDEAIKNLFTSEGFVKEFI